MHTKISHSTRGGDEGIADPENRLKLNNKWSQVTGVKIMNSVFWAFNLSLFTTIH